MGAETSYHHGPSGQDAVASRCVIGLRFGQLTVVGEETTFITRNGTVSKGIPVRCDCGQEKVVPLPDLKRGATKSCGCIKLGKRQPTTGEVFGSWTVIGDRISDGRVKVPCRCVCGTVRNVAIASLISGKSTSCGCLALKPQRDIQPGDTFGLWTVRCYAGRKRVGLRNRPIYECECYCGSIRDVLKSALLSGRSASCGCAGGTGDLRQMHGLSRDGESKSQLYTIWAKLQGVGANSSAWECNFAAFYDWATSTNYHEGMILSKFEAEQLYGPANCVWTEPLGGKKRYLRREERRYRYLSFAGKTTLATILSAALLFVGYQWGKRSSGTNDSAVTSYLQRLQPVERELEDVQENLTEISKGRHVEESLAHIEADANREKLELASMPDVPQEFSLAQDQFLEWARTLQSGVQIAEQRPTAEAMRQLSQRVDKAGRIHEHIEEKVGPEERLYLMNWPNESSNLGPKMLIDLDRR